MPRIPSGRGAPTTPTTSTPATTSTPTGLPPSINTSTSTTAVANVAPVAAPNAPDAATTAAITGPDGNPIEPTKVKIDGLKGGTLEADGGTRGSQAADFNGYDGSGSGAVDRGFIRVKAHATAKGALVEVNSFHSEKNDNVTYYLQMEVLDKATNQYRPITLSILEQDANLNGKSYRSTRHYEFNYDDINAWLKERNPNLELIPGHSKMAVAANFDSHNAGGFGRGGVFRAPALPGVQGPADVGGSANTGDETDLPLDMSVSYPPQLTAEISALKDDGHIVSRLESEYKGESTAEEMTAAIAKMYALAEQSASGQGLGIAALDGWSITYVTRYWVKDDGRPGLPGKPGQGQFKGFRVDDKGLPLQDPMRDTYMDNGTMGMTSHEGALRLRTNKQATIINVKPGGGRRDDKTGITQRVEVGLELDAGVDVDEAGETLRDLAESSTSAATVFNHAQDQVRELDETLALHEALDPWLKVEQDRHKFTLVNDETGVEVEISFDSIRAETIRDEHANADGSSRVVEFAVLEAELNHLQLQSVNNTDVTGIGMSESRLTSDTAQDDWLKNVSDDVTSVIDPRLHELKDLENKSFRSTTSYKQFENATAALLPRLFPDPAGGKKNHSLRRGRQKAAAAAQRLGLVYFEDRRLLSGVEKAVKGAGYQWTPDLKKAFDAALTDDKARKKLQNALAKGEMAKVPSFVKKFVGQPLAYDVVGVEARIASELQRIGLKTTSEIEKMLDGIAASTIKPAEFESMIQRLDDRVDDKVMEQLAKALGTTPVPKPVVDAKELAGTPYWDKQLRSAFVEHHVDSRQFDDVIAFFDKVADAGAQALHIRKAIRKLRFDDPQAVLDELAKKHDVEAPVLRGDVLAHLDMAKSSLKEGYFTLSDELAQLVAEIANKVPLSEIAQFADSLGSDAQQQIDDKAKAHGLTTVKAPHYFKGIHRDLAATAREMCFLYDDGWKAFVKTMVENGVDVDSLSSVLGDLQSDTAVKDALENNSVDVPQGVEIPVIKADVDKISRDIRVAFVSHAPVLPDQAKMAEFINATVEVGIAPGQINNIVSELTYGSLEDARDYYDYIDNIEKLPFFPFRVDGLITQIKANDPGKVTPAIEAYLREVLPEAIKNEEFSLGLVTDEEVVDVLSRMAELTDKPVPIEIMLEARFSQLVIKPDPVVLTFFKKLTDVSAANAKKVDEVLSEQLMNNVNLQEVLKDAKVKIPSGLTVPSLQPQQPQATDLFLETIERHKRYFKLDDVQAYVDAGVASGCPPTWLGNFVAGVATDGLNDYRSWNNEIGGIDKLGLPPFDLAEIAKVIEENEPDLMTDDIRAWVAKELPKAVDAEDFTLWNVTSSNAQGIVAVLAPLTGSIPPAKVFAVPAFTQARFQLDDKVATFMDKLIAGASDPQEMLTSVQGALHALESNGRLSAVLEEYGIDVPDGLTVPALKADVDALVKTAKEVYDDEGLDFLVPPDAALKAWVGECLRKGVPPGKIDYLTQQRLTRDEVDAASDWEASDIAGFRYANMPPIDVDKTLAEVKKEFAAATSSQLEYVAKAMAVAIDDDNLVPKTLFDCEDIGEALEYLGKITGLELPAEG